MSKLLRKMLEVVGIRWPTDEEIMAAMNELPKVPPDQHASACPCCVCVMRRQTEIRAAVDAWNRTCEQIPAVRLQSCNQTRQ